MPRFITRFKKVEYLDVENEAGNRHGTLHAAQESVKSRKGWRAEDVEQVERDEDGLEISTGSWTVAGGCDGCGRTLFDDEESFSGDEASLCEACYTQACEADTAGPSGGA